MRKLNELAEQKLDDLDNLYTMHLAPALAEAMANMRNDDNDGTVNSGDLMATVFLDHTRACLAFMAKAVEMLAAMDGFSIMAEEV